MGCGRMWPSVEPVTASAIAPGPCRGWGRNPLARIRVQKEPVVSPAGAGIDYRRPSGSPGGSPRKTPEDPPRRRKHAEQKVRGNGQRTKLPSRQPGRKRRGRRAHVAEGGACWGASRGARQTHRHLAMRWGNYLGDRFGWRAMLRLLPLARRSGLDSTGALPLQSG